MTTRLQQERLLGQSLAAGASIEELEEAIAQAARHHADERCPPPPEGGLTPAWERFRVLLRALAEKARR